MPGGLTQGLVTLAASIGGGEEEFYKFLILTKSPGISKWNRYQRGYPELRREERGVYEHLKAARRSSNI